VNGRKTVASLQYELLSEHPYSYTHEELIFETYIRHNEITGEIAQSLRDKLWNELFSKPQASLSSSPLPKKYGWGLHFNEEGKIGLVARGSDEYKKYESNEAGDVKLIPAAGIRGK